MRTGSVLGPTGELADAAGSIVALSSGQLPSGVAVVRLSGPAARLALKALAGGVPEPRRASLRRLRDAEGRVLDHALVLFFEAPNTVTGEDLAEFHLHGGRAVVAAVLAALCALPGIRLAVAGEFTRRAFLNGRTDLTQAEGLADLLAAETEAQRRRAVAQAGGALSALYDGWHGRLLRVRAHLEAAFDFSDEGDVPDDLASGLVEEAAGLAREIRSHLESAARGEILRDGYRVAIAGAPNAGKSSLMNWLAGREVAIVSDVPGTTRDVLEVTLDLGGVPVRLFDTAGLRETEDAVETIGIERAHRRIADADLVLLLAAPDAPVSHVKHARILTIGTKADLGHDIGGVDVLISTRDGTGLAELVDRLALEAATAAGDPDAVIPTRARHREILGATLAELETVRADLPPEILSEILRAGASRLGALTGRTDVEDLLDVIFSEFCVGK